MMDDEITRLTAENAALREDKARLDWLDGRVGGIVFDEITPDYWLEEDEDIRAAIDAAKQRQEPLIKEEE